MGRVTTDPSTEAAANAAAHPLNGVSLTDRGEVFVAFPGEGKTSFGEFLVGQLAPQVDLVFPYNLNPLQVTTRNNNSGSSTTSNSMAQLSTGAAANSSSHLVSNKRAKYSAGMGLKARFTAMFTTGVADSSQVAGVGDADQGFFFGYNGTSFGILHRYGGAREVRTLTVTTASTTAENITVTLDGNADATVAVTNTGDTTLTANEIAAHDYSDLGPGWTATAVGSTVVFVSWSASAQTGTYSIAGTTVVGSFAQTLAGVAPTETWVPQASWNGTDILDGNGTSGVTLDPTQLNVFQIGVQYLGAGAIRFFMERPDTGEFILVHTLDWANQNTRPTLDNPTLGFYLAATNVANTSDLTVSSASAAIFIEGRDDNRGLKRAAGGSLTLGATSAETPIFSIRLKEVFQGRINGGIIKGNYLMASVEHTKPCAINVYANATLTGASFSDLQAGASSAEVDTAATAFTGGILIFQLFLGKTGNVVVDLKDDLSAGEFNPGTTITFTLAPTSGNAAEGNVSVNFTEKL